MLTETRGGVDFSRRFKEDGSGDKEDPLSRDILYPKPLKEGDSAVVVSPSDSVKPKDLAKGVEVLKDWGLKVILGQGVEAEIAGFMAGTAEQRRQSMRWAICSDSDAILISGGGSAAFDVVSVFADNEVIETLRKTRPVIMGYSDTGLIAVEVLRLARLASWSGPHVGGLVDTWDERTVKDAWAAVSGEDMSIGPGEDWEVVQSGVGKIEGAVLVPINLSTAVAPDLGFLKREKTIVAIEDWLGAWEDARWHLSILCNRLDNITAFILGRFERMRRGKYPKWSQGMTAEKLLRDVIGDNREVAIAKFRRFGHPDEKKKDKGLSPMMMGARVNFSAEGVGTGNCSLEYERG